MSELFDMLPENFKNRLKNELGDENFEKYKLSLNENAVRGLRVNKNKISVSDFLAKTNLKLEKLNFCDDGFIFDSTDKIGNSAEHLSGLIYLQEPSSMLAVSASGIRNEKRPLKVLDLCASPGGKTSQIAGSELNNLLVFSNEIVNSRAQILFSNIERQGFGNVIVLNEKPENLIVFENYFDYVFVDAPCSGEGMFRKNPETINEWSEENVLMCAKRQREILSVATKLLKSGGKLVYSTCTFSKDEDEEVAGWLANEKSMKLCNVPDEIKQVTVPSSANVKNADYARKFYPFSGRGEGQFVAVFEKVDQLKDDKLYSKKHLSNLSWLANQKKKLVFEFINKNLKETPKGKFAQMGDNIYLVSEDIDDKILSALDSLKFMSIGIKFGSIKKDRFEPNHNAFMALENNFKQKIELSDEKLKKFLHGEELMCDITPQNISDYAVVTKNGFAVGGVKISNGKLKNLYPKGMRI